jgi:arsenate reductase (glutaredoxin)
LKTPRSRAQLASLIERMNVPVRSVLREKGTPFHELGIGDANLTDAQLLDAMMAHPILINRPIVGVKLCRPSEAVLDLLPNPQQAAFTKEDGERVVDEFGRRVAPAGLKP